MKTVIGDLWEYMGRGWIVIPTNLVCTKEGNAVMGLGVASQARDKFPGLPLIYGSFLRMVNYEPHLFTFFANCPPIFGGLVLFPTKEHWKAKARLDFIENGLQQLIRLPISAPIYLPFLGVGYGLLDQRTVRDLLDKYLTDDRFTLVQRGPDVEKKYAESFRSNMRDDWKGGFEDRSLALEKKEHNARHG